MDSTARFLLGGALGAALGYLLSQKNLEKAIQSGQLSVPGTVLATGGGTDTGTVPSLPSTVSPLATAATSTALAPESPAGRESAPVLPGREWRIPPAPPADWRPANEPWPSSTPSATPTIAPAEPPAPGPEDALPVVEAPAPAEAPQGSEVIITRDFLEEPIPGSGWRSSAPPVPIETAEDTARASASSGWAAEEAVAELAAPQPTAELPVEVDALELPVVEERVAEGTAAGSPAASPQSGVTEMPSEAAVFADTTLLDAPSRVDDLKSRIEETRRRIRHELEQPFETAVAPGAPERDWSFSIGKPLAVEEALVVEPAATLVLPEPAVSELAVAPGAVAMESVMSVPTALEQVTVEEVMVEPIPVETVALEEIAVEPTALETATVEPLVEEPVVFEPIAAEPVAEEPVVFEPVAAEDEGVPLVAVEPVSEAASPIEMAPAEAVMVEAAAETLAGEPAAFEPTAEPLTVEPATMEPVVMEPAATEPAVMEPAVMEPATAERAAVDTVETRAVTESVQVAVAAEKGGADAGLGLDEPVDYDSMKDRIETTRSRLKAKAFDAMMTGESALLGRDIAGTGRAHAKMAGVDSDIDQTIETSLREEEE